MKKNQASGIVFFLLIFLPSVFLSSNSMAQRGKSAFIELLGNGIGLSANFDSRFAKQENGLGFRIGVGFYPGTGINSSFTTVPLGLNYLAGKGPHYFEAGAGITLLPGGIDYFGMEDLEVEGVLFVPSAGYRYSPAGNGFQGRIFLSPWIGPGGMVIMGGLSAGFKF